MGSFRDFVHVNLDFPCGDSYGPFGLGYFVAVVLAGYEPAVYVMSPPVIAMSNCLGLLQ